MPLAAILNQASTRWFTFQTLNNNQKLMMRIILECWRRGVRVTVATIISTVVLWPVGHGFSYIWIEANDVTTVTNDWLAFQALNNASDFAYFPPAVVIIRDIDVP